MRPLRIVVAAFAAAAAMAGIAVAAARALTEPVATPWKCPPDAGVDLLPRCGTKLYSQHDEELCIRFLLHDRRGGVFLDVGSGQYQIGSTTYYLEHHLGWTGLAVDAQEQYGPDYAKFRPGTRFYSYLVTDHSGTMEPFYKLKTMIQMSSASREWAENAQKGPVQVVQKPTITLNDLLTRAGVDKIDFLSMDIETGEPAALAGFDIDKYHPDVACVETVATVRDRIVAYFAAHGYERVRSLEPYDQVNGYFVPARH